VLARVLELIEKYPRTRTCIAQEILGPDLTRLQNARGGKMKQENSACDKNRPVHRKRTRIDLVSFSVFSSRNYNVVLYACVFLLFSKISKALHISHIYMDSRTCRVY
jgi:hypothetical protein